MYNPDSERDIKKLRTQLLSHGHGPGGLQDIGDGHKGVHGNVPGWVGVADGIGWSGFSATSYSASALRSSALPIKGGMKGRMACSWEM